MSNTDHLLDGLSLNSPNCIEAFVPGLAGLVAPLSAEQFMAEYWQRRPLHVAGGPARLIHVTRLLFELELEQILAAVDLRETLIQPTLELQRGPLADPGPPPSPDPATFMALYERGNQLYIAGSEIPGVNEWIDRLSQDLGRLWSAGRGDIYATRAGGGADLHFDRNDNFTIQLRGRKLWMFSAEPCYPDPLHNSGDRDELPYDPSFAFDPASVDRAQLLSVMLEPGDMFYMPRGCLHGTHADEDSLSFNISLGAQSWAHVVLEGLHAWLVREPAWRRGATTDPELAAERIDSLRKLLDGLRGADLLAGPAASSSPSPNLGPLRRNPLAWWICVDRGADEVAVEIRTPARRSTTLEVSREFLPILAELPDGPERLSLDVLLARAGWAHAPDEGRAFAAALVEAGLLLEADATHD